MHIKMLIINKIILLMDINKIFNLIYNINIKIDCKNKIKLLNNVKKIWIFKWIFRLKFKLKLK